MKYIDRKRDGSEGKGVTDEVEIARGPTKGTQKYKTTTSPQNYAVSTMQQSIQRQLQQQSELQQQWQQQNNQLMMMMLQNMKKK